MTPFYLFAAVVISFQRRGHVRVAGPGMLYRRVFFNNELVFFALSVVEAEPFLAVVFAGVVLVEDRWRGFFKEEQLHCSSITLQVQDYLAARCLTAAQREHHPRLCECVKTTEIKVKRIE